MTQDHDCTRGEDIPAEALKAEDLVLDEGAAVEHDADAAEAAHSFHDLPPGNYLLRVTGFGEPKEVPKKVYLDKKPVDYVGMQVPVRFADVNNPSGRVSTIFLLPPGDATALMYYNHGTNANGKAEGFQAQLFGHFITRLIPGSYEKGQPLKPVARALKNWIGRSIWATVEAGRESERINDKTGEPYPPRGEIKPFSFREYVEGQPCPLGPVGPTPAGQEKPPAGARKPAGGQSGAASDRQPAMVNAGASANGVHADDGDNGLGDI